MHVTLLPPEPEAPPPLPDEPEMPPEETTPPLDEMAPPLPNTPETPPNALVPPVPESVPSQIEHGHGPMAGHSHPHVAPVPPKPVIPPNAWPPLPEPPKPPDCTPPLPRPPEPPTPLLFPPLAPPAPSPRLVRLQPSASNAIRVDKARPSRVVRIDSSLPVVDSNTYARYPACHPPRNFLTRTTAVETRSQNFEATAKVAACLGSQQAPGRRGERRFRSTSTRPISWPGRLRVEAVLDEADTTRGPARPIG
jgi:hypothetical protein